MVGGHSLAIQTFALGKSKRAFVTVNTVPYSLFGQIVCYRNGTVFIKSGRVQMQSCDDGWVFAGRCSSDSKQFVAVHFLLVKDHDIFCLASKDILSLELAPVIIVRFLN